jgi:hypothetical protein
MIIWNKVTWYSRYLALAFFTIVFPIWTFYLGMQYEKTVSELTLYSNLVPQQINESTPIPITVKPTTTPETKFDSGIRGNVTIGPTCPVERIPPDPNCEDKSYDPTLVFTNTKTKETKSIKVSSDGTFVVTLSPGTYTVNDQSEAVLPRMSPVEPVEVSANTYTEIKIEFDSGIR